MLSNYCYEIVLKFCFEIVLIASFILSLCIQVSLSGKGRNPSPNGLQLMPRALWEPAEWFQAHPDCIALWGGAPAMDILSLHMDLMHVKWLGIDCYYIGSLFAYVIDMKMTGSAQENISKLWSEIRGGYVELRSPTRLSSLSFTMYRANRSPFPCLKAKAAEVKCLIPVLVEVCFQYLQDSDFERLMYKGLLQSFAIDKCLAENASLARQNVG